MANRLPARSAHLIPQGRQLSEDGNEHSQSHDGNIRTRRALAVNGGLRNGAVFPTSGNYSRNP
jgi:hypothetical protein